MMEDKKNNEPTQSTEGKPSSWALNRNLSVSINLLFLQPVGTVFFHTCLCCVWTYFNECNSMCVSVCSISGVSWPLSAWNERMKTKWLRCSLTQSQISALHDCYSTLWHGSEICIPRSYNITCVLHLHTYLCDKPPICSQQWAYHCDYIVTDLVSLE